MMHSLTVEQVTVIARALRQARADQLDGDIFTRQLTHDLMERFPGLTACEAMDRIAYVRQQLSF